MSKQTKRLKVLVSIVRVLVIASIILVVGAFGMREHHQITDMECILRVAFFMIMTYILGTSENYLTKQLKKNIRRDKKRVTQ